MNYTKSQWWERFQKYYAEFPGVGLTVDLSRMNVSDEFFASMESRVEKALADMAALEKGAIPNPDENRIVGHYWLRNPALAPNPEIRKEIKETTVRIKDFAAQVHTGKIHGQGLLSGACKIDNTIVNDNVNEILLCGFLYYCTIQVTVK